MKKYRKKPVVIEAQQIKDSDFDDPHPNDDHVRGVKYDPSGRVVLIRNRGEDLIARVGDWVIRGINGELYPCANDVFVDSHELAE